MSVDILVPGSVSLRSGTGILFAMDPNLRIYFWINEPVLELELSGCIFSEKKVAKLLICRQSVCVSV
jgi:hypothetical protein